MPFAIRLCPLELNLFNGGGNTRRYTVLTNGLTGSGGANGGYHPIGNVSLASGDPIDITVFYTSSNLFYQLMLQP